MNVVFLSPLATNAQENKMFNLKKKLFVIRMAISSRETKMQTTSPAGYASTSRFPPYLKISHAYPMTPSEKVLLFLSGKKLLHF